MKISDICESRQNNFNLIRMAAAVTVVVSHSLSLSYGNGYIEPIDSRLGKPSGEMAVDIFFVTSGFLVTSSIIHKDNILEFFIARILRIYPALLAMLFLTITTLGIFFCNMKFTDFLQNQEVFYFFLKCSTLVFGVYDRLPGVFENNPYREAVNGSLWTMPYEVRMYIILAFLYFLMRIVNKNIIYMLMIISISLLMCFAVMQLEGWQLIKKHNFFHLYFMFFSGSAYYILRNFIYLNKYVASSIFLSILISAGFGKYIFQIFYPIGLPYLVLYAAYVPSGILLRYNRLGDYSYGTYIYSFSLEQMIAALIPGVRPWQMVAIALPVVFLCAVLSWTMIERKALALKEKITERVRIHMAQLQNWF